jgi:DNA polymerase
LQAGGGACNPQGVSPEDADLAELAALTAEHLRWEMELGARGLPDLIEELYARRAGAGEPAAPTVDPTGAPPAPEAGREAADAPLREAPTGDVRARLAVIAEEAASCTKCGLHTGRTKSVFARGNPGAVVAFVGEGPGYHEDQQGLPFVGNAGALLDKMIGAMGLGDDDIYICNVVKCRPPENRTPNPDEAAACMPYLRQQLELVKPEVIVALGRCAAENLGIAGRGWRGEWGSWEGIRVMPTYHPAYLLRNPEHKRLVWQDLQKVVSALGRELPRR